MCGIAGALGPADLPPGRLDRVLARMRSRGPDGEGAVRLSLGGAPLVLLHTRLAIVDPQARSDQPFRKDGVTLVFNGEIYNHPELRRELEGLGHRFTTAGDTEVIVEAYRAWGPDAVDRFEGMWAFALHDAGAGRLWLSRDRFGEKPLYTWWRSGMLYFASEVKALAELAGERPAVNPCQLRRYLVNGYKGLYRPGETFFEEVAEFPAAHSACLTTPERPCPKRYWDLSFAPGRMSADEALEGVKDRVARAVELRLRADVPVAIRLSGGVDSNVVTGMALEQGQDVTAFSLVEDDPRYDETAGINLAIAHYDCCSEIVRIPRQGFLDRLGGLVEYFDGPPMTISYYLHALVSEAIHKAGFKVSLGGTGADEVFSGYYDHYLFWLAAMKDRPDFDELVEGWRGTYGRFVRNPHLQDPLAFIRNPQARDHIFLGSERFAGFLTDAFDEPHAEDRYCDDPLRNRMLNELFTETVPVMLHEDDLAAMAWSVENRAPYLDRGLVEFMASVPTEHLVQQGLPKFLLRAAGKGLAPDAILDNPRKQGINAPVTAFVDFSDAQVRESLLADGPIWRYVDRDRASALLGSEIALNSESKFVFSLIAARLFLDRWDA